MPTILPDEQAPQRRGSTNAVVLRSDESEIVAMMRRIEQRDRPGLLVVYYNGSNWMLYHTHEDTPRHLPNT